MNTTKSALLLLILCLVGSPADAQINLSGVWNNLGLMHEDWPDRWPGPEVGDYAGVPLNDAARLRADTWDASSSRCPSISAASIRPTTCRASAGCASGRSATPRRNS